MTTGIASAGGSIVAYSLIQCWRRHSDKTKVRGALLPIGKSYAEKNLIEDNNTIFFDLDGTLSETPIRDIEKSKLRLEYYPKASLKVKEVKAQQKNKVIVIMSESYELLQHVGLKPKNIKAYLPTQKFFADNENLPAHLEKARMTMEIAVPTEHRVYYNTYDGLSTKLCRKYCKNSRK